MSEPTIGEALLKYQLEEQLKNKIDERRLELIKTILPALIAKGVHVTTSMVADVYSDKNDFVKDGYGRVLKERKQPEEYWYVDEAIKYADAVLKKLEYK